MVVRFEGFFLYLSCVLSSVIARGGEGGIGEEEDEEGGSHGEKLRAGARKRWEATCRATRRPLFRRTVGQQAALTHATVRKGRRATEWVRWGRAWARGRHPPVLRLRPAPCFCVDFSHRGITLGLAHRPNNFQSIR